MSKFTPSPQEVALVNQIFTQAGAQKIGVVTGEAAVKIFSGSKLAPSVLAEVWSLADDDNKGVLTRKDVAVAIRLLGHAQRGERVSESLIHKPGPVPSIEGINAPISQQVSGIPLAKSPPPGLDVSLPPLTAQDKTKFIKLFNGYGPQNGLLAGDKARDVFVKSKLPVDKLSQIWNLADTQNRGALDVTDFTVAMYLIQASMSGALKSIPAILPPYIYEQARPGPDIVATHTSGSSGFSSPTVGGFTVRPSTGILPQYTGQIPLQPQSTGQRATAPPTIPSRTATMPQFPLTAPTSAQSTEWQVTPAEKANSDRIFETIDTQNKGYIEGEVAVPIMLQSKLSDDILAQIWDLADINHDGRLTRDGFAVATHLIQAKLSGKELPLTLPPTLVPPSMRNVTPSTALAHPSGSEAIRDLLWDDTPPSSASQPSMPTLLPQSTGTLSPHAAQAASTFLGASDPFGSTSSTFTTQLATVNPPHKDLLGDDDESVAASPPLQDKSAEIGNVQNQLHSTNRALATAKNEREDLERKLADQASQLAALQTQLSSAKAGYETETKHLAQLRERYSQQAQDIQKARQELIHAESDLSSVRVDKAEVEGSVLRDKEEVRELQRRMAEVGQEVERLKAEAEKARKEAKQQKGLLAIAKKQLATRETEKAKVQKELEDARAEAAQLTLEREEADVALVKAEESAEADTQRVASPAESLTGFAAAQPLPASPEIASPDIGSPVSNKSTNPFERLAVGSGTPRSQSPFLPFASSVISTPPAIIAPPAGAESLADPFGFEDAFNEGDSNVSLPNVEAPHTGSKAFSDERLPSVTSDTKRQSDVMSPVDSEQFHTPPTTATRPTSTADTEKTPDISSAMFSPTSTFPTNTETQEKFPEVDGPAKQEEHTDLTTGLRELEVDESDSSDSDDDEPLTNVKAKLKDDVFTSGAHNAAQSPGFDDIFETPRVGPFMSSTGESSVATPPDATPKPSSSPFSAMTAAPSGAQDIANTSSAPAGVSDFDEAMGLSGSSNNTSQFLHVSDFTFDSAFDDDFDFAAAKAATTSSPKADDTSALVAAFPPAPSAPTSNGFGSAFSHPSTTVSSAVSEQRSLSFEDAFGTNLSTSLPANAVATPPAVQAVPSSASHGVSFEDVFGGSLTDASTTDEPLSGSTTSELHAGSPPALKGSTVFPTVSTPSSPIREGSPSFDRRSLSPPPRQISPPPRGSPKSRPSTASSEKDKSTRHSKLSIRLPFGRKKAKHEPMPSHLSQSLLVEEPGHATPAAEDDIEAVKTLCSMGFSRTQAVTALEQHDYDVQRALNSLLGTR